MDICENLMRAYSLIDRLENRTIGSLLESAAPIIKDVYFSENEFMDMLEDIGDTAIIRVGVIQASDLNIPTVKRKNPQTNRMKGYPDYSPFESDGGEKVAAIAKLTSYGIMYRKKNKLDSEYVKWKDAVNQLNPQYGLPTIGDRTKEKDYRDKTGYGSETMAYKGNDETKKGNLYMSVNLARLMGKTTQTYYLLNAEGRVIREMTEQEVAEYLPLRKEHQYERALRKMGRDDQYIKEYMDKLKGLGKMKYRNFEFNHILYVSATVNGLKTGYINRNVSRDIDGVRLDSADFAEIAAKRYGQEHPETDTLNPAQDASGLS